MAQLAARGVRNRDIAQRLFITPKTVEWHLGNAYRKLELHSRGSLIGALGEPEPLEQVGLSRARNAKGARLSGPPMRWLNLVLADQGDSGGPRLARRP